MKRWTALLSAGWACLAALSVTVQADEAKPPLDRPDRILAEGLSLRNFAISYDGSKMAVSIKGSGAALVEWPTGKLVKPGIENTDANIMDLTSDGLFAELGPRERSILLWRPPASAAYRTLVSPGAPFGIGLFSPDGRWFACGDNDGLVTIWDTSTGELVHRLNGHIASIWAMAFSPDGQRVATGSDDNDICIWDVRDGRLLRRITTMTHAVWAIVWSTDGSRLYAGGPSCCVSCLDPKNGNCLFESPRGTQAVYALAVSPDGRTIAEGDQNLDSGRGPADIHLFKSGTLEVISVIHAHLGIVYELGFSRDGRTLLSSSSDDQGIKVWKVAQ